MHHDGVVEYSARDGRAYVTLNQSAKKNAMTTAMWEQLMGYYDRAESDDDGGVVILHGAGCEEGSRIAAPCRRLDGGRGARQRPDQQGRAARAIGGGRRGLGGANR